MIIDINHVQSFILHTSLAFTDCPKVPSMTYRVAREGRPVRLVLEPSERFGLGNHRGCVAPWHVAPGGRIRQRRGLQVPRSDLLVHHPPSGPHGDRIPLPSYVDGHSFSTGLFPVINLDLQTQLQIQPADST